MDSHQGQGTMDPSSSSATAWVEDVEEIDTTTKQCIVVLEEHEEEIDADFVVVFMPRPEKKCKVANYGSLK